MQNLQDIFSRISTNKAKLKDLKSQYNEALSSIEGYKNVLEEMKTLRAKKKEYEMMTKEQFSEEFIKIDDLKIDIESDKELLSDAALSQYVKGESVSVQDEHNNEYEPVFQVNFKKMK